MLTGEICDPGSVAVNMKRKAEPSAETSPSKKTKLIKDGVDSAKYVCSKFLPVFPVLFTHIFICCRMFYFNWESEQFKNV